MADLHLTKVAVGCTSVEDLAHRLAVRAVDAVTDVQTRYRPKRADELIGGSLFWILKHRLVARQTILGFEDIEDGRRCRILLAADVVTVRPLLRRAHQGWRYLAAADAPGDVGAGEGGMAALPAHLAGELAALALL